MKNIFLILLSTIVLVPIKAQVITADPAFPLVDQAVTIYFDATQGNQGLMGYTGDVYAHTGVITSESTSTADWKHVLTSWGENTAETKLTRISEDYYKLEITPSIFEYYGINDGETVQKMAFVFRSGEPYTGTTYYEGKDTGNKDIFYQVYEEGLNISFITPDRQSVVEQNSVVDLEASVSKSSTINLYLNNSFVKSVSGTSITHSFTLSSPGDNWIKLTANDGNETTADSVFVHVLDDQVLADLPEGLQDGINYISDDSVCLVLYAPNKENVFVIGDFNDWIPSSKYRMALSANRYWLGIGGLTPGEEYAFQYMVDNDIRIADPYTDKILDPYNDKYITSDTYPDLKQYPTGKTDGNVGILQTAQTAYEWKTSSFQAPEIGSLVIYEMLLRDFLAAHDWQTLVDTLDYLQNLGVTAIELMPFSEFEGNESWGYNPSFYFAPDKYYGPKNDLKMFIDSCHSRGMAVIQDMVLNHSMGQSPLAMLYWDYTNSRPAADNPWYNAVSPNPVYAWGSDFNHESQATKDFVDRVVSYWIDEYKVDGYRFDFTKGFTNTTGDGWAYDLPRINILKRIADTIWNHNPDAYVILEHFTDNTEETVLTNYGMAVWGNLNYSYCQASMGFSSEWDFTWVSYKYRGFTNPNLVGYMESHDEERQMYKDLNYGNSSGDYSIKDLNTALARVELTSSFFIPIPGPKMIWQFGELGYDYSIEYNERVGNKPIRWDYFDVGARKRLYLTYAALNKLKASEPAFSTTSYSLDLSGKVKQIALNHDDMNVRIIGNFDVVENTGVITFPATGTWYDYFSGEELQVTQASTQMTLLPGEYHIYTDKVLETPVRPSEIQGSTRENEKLILYPNPAHSELLLETGAERGNVVIMNLSGQAVLSLPDFVNGGRIDLSSIPQGLYLLVFTDTEGNKSVGKFVKE